MQEWSAKLRNVIPEADVIGILRDKPGYLVRVHSDQPIDAHYLDIIGKRLQKMGAAGWSWEVCEVDVVKIRVYTQSSARPLYGIALLSVLLAIYYDVHGIAEAIGCWTGP